MNAVHEKILSGVTGKLQRKVARGASMERVESKGSLDREQGEVQGKRRKGLRQLGVEDINGIF